MWVTSRVGSSRELTTKHLLLPLSLMQDVPKLLNPSGPDSLSWDSASAAVVTQSQEECHMHKESGNVIVNI